MDVHNTYHVCEQQMKRKETCRHKEVVHGVNVDLVQNVDSGDQDKEENEIAKLASRLIGAATKGIKADYRQRKDSDGQKAGPESQSKSALE